MIRSLIQKVLLGIIIVSSIYKSESYLIATEEFGSLDEDPVAVWENKFRKLKMALPAEVGVVGYLGDWDVDGIIWGAGDQYGEYVLLQYTLAPVVAERSMDHEWVVGNLTPQAFEKWQSTAEGVYEVSFFRGNLYLIHKVAP